MEFDRYKVGDILKCVSTDKIRPEWITINKEYRIVAVRGGRYWIVTDTGTENSIPFDLVHPNFECVRETRKLKLKKIESVSKR